jgi:hypothetical protein
MLVRAWPDVLRRCAENGLLRERILMLEKEISLRVQMIQERDVKLKEIEGLVRRFNVDEAQPKRNRRRRPSDDYYYDDYDDDEYEDYERRGSGGLRGRRRFEEDEYEEASKEDEKAELEASARSATLARRTPALRRAVVRPASEDNQSPQRTAVDKKAHVRQLFERPYDEL